MYNGVASRLACAFKKCHLPAILIETCTQWLSLVFFFNFFLFFKQKKFGGSLESLSVLKTTFIVFETAEISLTLKREEVRFGRFQLRTLNLH